MISVSKLTQIGFDKTWFIPLLRARFTYASSVWPVTATIIGWCNFLSKICYLISPVASYPSMNGMLQSIMMRSQSQDNPLFDKIFYFTRSRACLPSNALSHIFLTSMTLTEYFKMTMIASMLNPWSSTIRILLGLLNETSRNL